MDRVKYLIVFGAILFGLSISFYLLNWARIIHHGRFRSEWKYHLWAIPFFFFTLGEWYLSYEDVNMMEGFGDFFMSFVSIGLLFIISAVINPDSKEGKGWPHLKTKTDEVALIMGILMIWDYLYYIVYRGEKLLEGLPISTAFGVACFLHFILKKTWTQWAFIVLMYLTTVFAIVQIW